MATIKYEIAGFTSPLPNGLVSPTSGEHNVPMGRLAWAAATIGTTPYGPRRQRRAYALELQWRESMMRASIQPRGACHWRSNSYARLDPAEKGAVSFFLGQAQAKLFAHDFFRISRFVHLDFVLEHTGQLRNRTRPDFLGLQGRNSAIAVEAKGRSLGCEDRLVDKAKDQVRSLPNIKGYSPPVAYAHIAYFEGDMWSAYMVDPPRGSGGHDIDPAALTLAYYLPLVNAIQGGQATPERVRIWDEVAYLRRYFEEIDCAVAVREDIATLVPPESPARQEADFSSSGAQLYDHILSLDEEREVRRAFQDRESDTSFLGADGIAVQLGSSWLNWPEDT